MLPDYLLAPVERSGRSRSTSAGRGNTVSLSWGPSFSACRSYSSSSTAYMTGSECQRPFHGDTRGEFRSHSRGRSGSRSTYARGEGVPVAPASPPAAVTP